MEAEVEALLVCKVQPLHFFLTTPEVCMKKQREIAMAIRQSRTMGL